MVRRHAVLTLAAAAFLLGGCSDDPGITSDRADLESAVAVWSDPWVAPTSATVAGPALGSNGQVSRVVARRTTAYDRGVRSAAQSELHWAKSHGWSRTSSTCGDSVQVALVSPDGEALAQLVVTPDGDGAEAAVQVVTRHHLDASWEVPGTIERTCLDTGSPPFEAPALASTPIGDADATDDTEASWEDDGADDALLEEAHADPALDALGLQVAAPGLEVGVNRRLAPAAEGTTDATTITDLAEQLPDWRLTYAACGGQGATLATFVRELGSGPAVVSARLDADGTSLRVTLPMTEGPDPTWLDDLVPLEGSACLGDTSRLPRHSGGTPAVLPTELTPIAD
ncbi:hypothetical protein GCM10023339_02610 [Alloalcanivorax gelatiniphagus]